jgi:Protein of unknown function (DUF3108)
VRQLRPEDHRRPLRPRAALSALAAGLALLATPRAHADELKPFQATYNWIWNGMTVAATTVQLEKSGDTWTYTSRSEPRGVGKLMSQRPRTVSVLRVTANGVEPMSYKGDDGTSSNKRTINLNYDWTQHRVTGVYEQTPVDLPLTADVQDDSSVQVALMAALLGGRTPDHFSVIDKNSVREYRYRRDGTETLKTPFGDVATLIYSSSRANSPRVNRYWCAPARGFIPLRVQQKRGDAVEWTMEIQSLTRQ